MAKAGTDREDEGRDFLDGGGDALTERERAEAALRASEEKYRALFDSIDEGLAILELIRDESGKPIDVLIVEVNGAFERLSGLVGMRGKRRSEVGPPYDPIWLQIHDQVLRSGEAQRLEHPTVAGGKWFRAYISRIGGEGSRQLAVVFDDISERKRRERSQALLTELSDQLIELERVPEAMEQLGEKIARHFEVPWCLFSEISPDLEKGVASQGWNAPEVPSLKGTYHLRDFLSDDLRAALVSGEPSVMNDSQNDARLNAAQYAGLGILSYIAVPLARDRPCRFLLSILDRKVRIWRDDEIELMRELTERIWPRIQRTRAEEALRQNQARLQEADRRKNEFLAMLGHELRNPLAAIRSGIVLLGSEKARPESRAMALPIVAEQAAHMERLVDDLLDLTRIVEGRIQVQRQRMALQDSLRQALDMVRLQTEAGGFEIDLREPAAELEILGDRVRLAQVFMNVIGNAVKYSGDSRRIDISAEREGDVAVVWVRDYGVGMSPDLLPRIFEPFMQAAPGLTLQSGLGLGLAVARQLVRLHDGDVEAFSDGEGKGSLFVLRFPLCLDADQPRIP